MIYLASPYSHEDQSVREIRFQAACRAAAHLINEGNVVFAPVVYGHPLAKQYVPTDWSAWEPFCRKQLSIADEVVVLCIQGWEDSAGIKEEIVIAELNDTPIRALSHKQVPTIVDYPYLKVKRSPLS